MPKADRDPAEDSRDIRVAAVDGSVCSYVSFALAGGAPGEVVGDAAADHPAADDDRARRPREIHGLGAEDTSSAAVSKATH